MVSGQSEEMVAKAPARLSGGERRCEGSAERKSNPTRTRTSRSEAGYAVIEHIDHWLCCAVSLASLRYKLQAYTSYVSESERPAVAVAVIDCSLPALLLTGPS